MTHSHTAPASIPSSGEPQTFLSVAVRRAWTGDMGCAEAWLRYLDGDELDQAISVLWRLAALGQAIRFEPLRERSATAHDLRVEPVPVGVQGYAIGIRSGLTPAPPGTGVLSKERSAELQDRLAELRDARARAAVASQGYMVAGPAGSAHGAPDWRDE